MKKIILLLMMIPMAYAFTAGDDIVFSIENCKEWVVLEVVPQTPVEAGEYWLDNCDNTQDHLWMCYCNETSTEITLHTSPNALNVYNLTISYEFQTPNDIQTHRGGSGGGRSYIYIQNKTNVTDTVIKEVVKEVTPECEDCEDYGIDDVFEDLEPITAPEPEKVRQELGNMSVGLFIVFIIVVLGLLGYGLYNKYKKTK